MSSKGSICVRCGTLKINNKCKCESIKSLEVKKEKPKQDCKNGLHSVRWRKKRAFIIKRDRGFCQRCLIKYNIINSSNLTVHHIKSRNDYPELMYEDDNLITLCLTCNLNLGTTNKLDFEQHELNNDDFNL